MRLGRTPQPTIQEDNHVVRHIVPSLRSRGERCSTRCGPRACGTRGHRPARWAFGRPRLGIVLSAHTAEDGATIFRQACKMGLEGIVSKRLSAPYRSGPSKDWIKVKNPDSPAMIRAREAEW
jgi:ATP dependent DNA ligase domain